MYSSWEATLISCPTATVLFVPSSSLTRLKARSIGVSPVCRSLMYPSLMYPNESGDHHQIHLSIVLMSWYSHLSLLQLTLLKVLIIVICIVVFGCSSLLYNTITLLLLVNLRVFIFRVCVETFSLDIYFRFLFTIQSIKQSIKHSIKQSRN